MTLFKIFSLFILLLEFSCPSSTKNYGNNNHDDNYYEFGYYDKYEFDNYDKHEFDNYDKYEFDYYDNYDDNNNYEYEYIDDGAYQDNEIITDIELNNANK